MELTDKISRKLRLRQMLDHRKQLGEGLHPIYVEYPVVPRVRYGTKAGPHPALAKLVEGSRENARQLLKSFAAHADKLAAIPVSRPSDDRAPHWTNGWMQGLDSAALYAMPGILGSRLYVEIGSGNSTKFVRRSVDDGTSAVRIVSIDPAPRAGIDALCDEVIRKPLEDVDLAVFNQLEAGDILVVDNSHYCFQNSDVTVVFLDIIPQLKPGVVIYIDDIFLPFDYPEDWLNRFYSEQYLLAAMLLADAGRRYEVLFPGYFCYVDPEMKAEADRFWQAVGLPQFAEVRSNGFWLRVRG